MHRFEFWLGLVIGLLLAGAISMVMYALAKVIILFAVLVLIVMGVRKWLEKTFKIW